MSFPPPVTLDRASPVPLYFQVAEQFERAIVDGALRPGDRLENEIALAQQLGLSRPTIRQAIQLLVDKGMLVRKRGVGTQVVHGQVRRTLELTSLFDDLNSAGQGPRTRILRQDRIPADAALSHALRTTPDDEIWDLERLRLIGDEPLAILRNYLRCDMVDLAPFDLENEGLYSSLRRANVSMSVAQQRIGSRRATPAEAALLAEEPGAPLLTMERTAYDNEGRVVEFGRHVYRPDFYAFEMTLIQK
ncbi:GntR family transcriptional regulator [Actinoplanes derwentensis]|uniref:DNA-binding transcriptional regulator, GntR family n=1 Tax=Actinoplanes derwentensis TaxID=113562 RepID=A0A1H1V6P1_9ACTN|nr:GntR family transcriptional regulator [Actinoplanes derwentensis]GID89250.1 transcriptional regulator [Actinoplanes derwentensis]SDS80474.1 DNA-binding transcriptional regulator, GntR family [Actinoplanes derwentensis]